MPNFASGRTYYGPMLYPNQGPWYSSEEQQVVHPWRSSLTNLSLTAGVLGGIYGSGFIPYKGLPLWNRYAGAMRTLEEYSPGGILRTFQLSTLFSSFGTGVIEAGVNRPNFGFISPEGLAKSPKYLEYISRLIGNQRKPNATQRLLSEGITLRTDKLFWGQGEEIALERASAFVAPTEGVNRLGEGWFLGMGMQPGNIRPGRTLPSNMTAFRRELAEQPFQIIGGKNRLQFLQRHLRGTFAELMSRPNRILEAPFSVEPLKSIFGALHGKYGDITERFLGKRYNLNLAVKYGTGTQMAGRFALKYGLAIPLLAGAYSTLDWLGRETTGWGPTDLIAGAGIQANLLASRFAEITGGHAYREKQEEIAPGSTSLQKLLAIPALGIFGGMSMSFGARLWRTWQNQKAGMSATNARIEAVKYLELFSGQGPLSKFGRYLTKEEHIYSRTDFLGSFIRKIARPDKEGNLYFKGIGRIGPTKFLAGLGALIGTGLILPFLPGALIPSKRPDELEAIYTGKQEVPIYKNRWWEMGRSPYEGTKVDYYRPHWYARMRQRGRERSIWGNNASSPLSKWFRTNFTYELERKHYADRPYPVTGLPFADVPLLGPILSHTIGRLIKPPQYMHQEEWQGPGDTTVDLGPGYGETIATELGEKPTGRPISPTSIKNLIGEQIYRFSELTGLPGFMAENIKESLTGTRSFFEQEAQLASSADINSLRRQYWDLNLGGALGMSEMVRRFIPSSRKIEQYNPIRNTMPEWLPGAGEKAPDFLHGDSFTKIPEGEIRLPGKGYATRFPVLKGVAPEDYPLIHQFKILADVAPYSDQYKSILAKVRAQRRSGELSPEEESLYDTTMEQIKTRKAGKQFASYEYLSPMGEIFTRRKQGDKTSSLMATINRMKSSGPEEPGIFTKLFGGYWELLSHNAETALDQLTPISPGAKLVHQRSAIEDYERTQVYGTENAFWQKPWTNFIRPTLQLTGKAFGYGGVPGHIQNIRDTESYFDILQYVKSSRLANIARQADDAEAVAEFEKQKDSTMFGLNPYTYNFSALMTAIPRRERDYFNEFSAAETDEEKARILDLVPENMKSLYVARWRLNLANDIRKAKKQGALSEAQLKEAQEITNTIYSDAATEGMPKTQELWAEYIATRLPGESYGDWYRRVHLLTEQKYIPGPDWVGWHPQVDLEDIKLKLVQNRGEDMHDYNLWPSRAARVAYKPYITPEATEEAYQPGQLSSAEIQQRLRELTQVSKLQGASVFVRNVASRQPETNVKIEYNQEANIPPVEVLTGG